MRSEAEGAQFDCAHYLTLLEPFRVPAPPLPGPDAHLPVWRWSASNPYNGFSGELRERVWQLQVWAYKAGTLARPKACALCASGSRVVFHSENYADPWTSIPLCQGCHMAVHGRFRYPAAWARFQARHHRPGVEHWLDLLPITPIDLAGWLTAGNAPAASDLSDRKNAEASERTDGQGVEKLYGG